MEALKDFNKVIYLPAVKTQYIIHKSKIPTRISNAKLAKILHHKSNKSEIPKSELENLREEFLSRKDERLDVASLFSPQITAKNPPLHFVPFSPQESPPVELTTENDNNDDEIIPLKSQIIKSTTNISQNLFLSPKQYTSPPNRNQYNKKGLQSNTVKTIGKQNLFLKRQPKYFQLYDKIVATFKKTNQKYNSNILYSEALDDGLIPLTFMKPDLNRVKILFRSGRLEAPKHVKEKFSKNTHSKFTMQQSLRKKF